MALSVGASRSAGTLSRRAGALRCRGPRVLPPGGRGGHGAGPACSAEAGRACAGHSSPFGTDVLLSFPDGRRGLDLWVGKMPWRRKWQPTPALWPGESHGRRSLVRYSPCGRRESDTTERLHWHRGPPLTSSLLPGPSNGLLLLLLRLPGWLVCFRRFCIRGELTE